MKEEDFDFIDTILRFFRNLGVRAVPLTANQLALIAADKEAFIARCTKINIAHDEREDRYQKEHDNKCPNCGALKGEIVNKIRQVHGDGSGEVSGNLFGISGSSSFHIDTDGVNHCNKCGNEWKKYKKDIKWLSDVKKDGLNYTANLINDPHGYSWAKDVGSVVAGCYIETILEVGEEVSYDLYESTKETLCFSKLRPYFKSVKDAPENKIELQNLYK